MSAVVQRKSFDPATTAVHSINFVLDAAITAGSFVLVVFACSYGGTRGNFTVVDGGSNSFTRVAAASLNGGFSNLQDIHTFYYQNHPGGQTTLTITTDQNDFGTTKGWIIEFSGLATTGAVVTGIGQIQDPTTTTTDAISSSALTTVNANDLLVGWTYDADHSTPGTGTLSAGTSFTSAAGDAIGNLTRGEFRTVASPSSVSATFTHSAVGVHFTVAVALKEAAAAAGQPTARRLALVEYFQSLFSSGRNKRRGNFM